MTIIKLIKKTGIHITSEEVKLSLFTHDKILRVENPEASTRKL